MALSLLYLRNSVKAPVSLRFQCFFFTSSSSFDSNGGLSSTSAWPLVLGGRRGIGGRKTQVLADYRGGGEQVRLPCGSTLSLPLIPNHVVLERRVYSELHIMELGSRGFCSSSDVSVECDDGSGSEDDNEDGEVEVNRVDSCADRKEVERIGKVIDEMFALDRNMEAVLDGMAINLSHDLVVEVLERFRHARKPALRFFCWAAKKKEGYAHDSRTYNSIISILAKAKQFETVVSLLEEMGAQGLLTMDTFTIVIKAFAAAKERKKAVGIVELMKKYEFEIGVETVNCLLDSLGRAKLGKEAQVLFDKLKERFTPNLKTYTVLLSGWYRVENLMEAARTWNDMIDRGFKPDIVAHNIMLEGLFRSRKRSDAIKLFHVMKSKGPSPNVRSYTIMIRDFCKQSKMETAVEYFDEMSGSGLQPDTDVYTCLITGYGTCKKLDTVYELLEEMQEKGCLPDSKTYNALIKILTSQKMPEHATRIYNKMIENGIEPTIRTFNMMMKSHFRKRNYEMGRGVWEEMIGKGICPDENSYSVLVTGLVREGKPREACEYLEEMLDKGMKVPQIDYNKLAADFYRDGKTEIFKELSLKAKFSGKFAASEIFSRWAQMTRR
ncbi:PREDICTED: pentatricopeptide repeat-containing protein At3g62470, mitochondrial [Tarenaya hassleriana]|uniref:pentatricopeptide repeat-containing protein At3g62470, mitochondrial n=1 Tax=Tarenaya hassleriana TaxID=28532 RepID=UPI00053C6CBD|nr:PREDICTED: pentatricopeptide repeat-containing protein At3g62470, mitochondrial [Tarenaya hassleriana]